MEHVIMSQSAHLAFLVERRAAPWLARRHLIALAMCLALLSMAYAVVYTGARVMDRHGEEIWFYHSRLQHDVAVALFRWSFIFFLAWAFLTLIRFWFLTAAKKGKASIWYASAKKFIGDEGIESVIRSITRQRKFRRLAK